MFLFNVFLNWNAPIISESFHNLVLRRDDLHVAQTNEASSNRLSSYRLLEYDAHKIRAYKHFLGCCKDALERVEEKPLLDFIVHDLMASPGLLLNDKEACDKLTQIFCLHFQNQDNVLELAPMGQAFVGEPTTFAAFLRYLLKKGLTAEGILSTQLLQDFFLYYCSTIGQIGNPVHTLYHILEAFPETLPLISLAKRTSCGESSLRSYALDGSAQHPKGSLTQRANNPRIISYTPDKDNLNALHAVFGINFLMAVLYQWDSQKQNPIWTESIAHLFNQSYTVAIQLPDLLSRLYEQVLLQKTLAKILTNDTLTTLVQKRVGNILFLIPFCPQLGDAIQTTDLPAFIQGLRDQTTDEVAFISNVFGLYDGVKHNIDARKLTMNVLLDAFLSSAYALDDIRLVEKLRSCLKAHDGMIMQKVRELETDLDTIIQSNTQGSIESMDHISIEDVWRISVVNIKNLQSIEHVKSSCPLDKYKLYNRLAITFFEHQNTRFDLDAFTNALDIAPDFAVDNVTLYERLLIELLVAIDDNSFRTMCIERLDTHAKHPWRTHLYNDMSLIKHATLAGNLGLIQWIERTNITHVDSYDSLASCAAELEKWAVVAYYNTHKHLSQPAVKHLLSLAVLQDALQLVPSLLMHEGCDIEPTLMQAVRLNKQESIRCILMPQQKPRNTILVRAFILAMSLNDFDNAKLIGESGLGDAMQSVIDSAFVDAVNLNKCDVLNSLATYVINLPTENLVTNALSNARIDNKMDVIQSLLRFPSTKTAQTVRAAITSCETPRKQQRTSHHMVTRALSCSALTTLHHGFFKSVDNRQRQSTQSTSILTPDPSIKG